MSKYNLPVAEKSLVFTGITKSVATGYWQTNSSHTLPSSSLTVYVGYLIQQASNQINTHALKHIILYIQ